MVSLNSKQQERTEMSQPKLHEGHKLVYNKDGLAVSHSYSPNYTATENKGFVELPSHLLIGAKIVDVMYENTYMNDYIAYKDEEWAKDRDFKDEWKFDNSNTVFIVRATDNNIYRMQIQRDEENNGNGYVNFLNADGSMFLNEHAGQEYKKLGTVGEPI
jgi:hypothetical protein